MVSKIVTFVTSFKNMRIRKPPFKNKGNKKIKEQVMYCK